MDLIIETTLELMGYQPTNDDEELLPTYSVASLPLKMGYAFSLILGIGLQKAITRKLQMQETFKVYPLTNGSSRCRLSELFINIVWVKHMLSMQASNSLP